jgi:glycosyltransferase involved in cell wall biosynthesis
MKLCLVTTTPLIVDFFLGRHLTEFSRVSQLSLVFNAREGEPAVARGLPLRLIDVPIHREIAPAWDMLALIRLIWLFWREKPDGVISVAPKAGLLAIVAAWVACVPFRCHVFQGEVWATRRGAMRALLRTADQLTARCSTHQLVVSRSEREFLAREGVIDAAHAQVLGSGSISGVDIERFHPAPLLGKEVRQEIGAMDTDVLVLFLGRLKRDKGVLDLARAWAPLATADPRLRLLFVGPDEDGLRDAIEAEVPKPVVGRLSFEGLTPSPERYLAAADIVCLPSYREGFPITVLEGAAMGLPVLASRIYGIEDAVVENVTGLLHCPGDVEDLRGQLDRLIREPDLRRRLGEAGKARVQAEFEAGRVVARYVAFVSEAIHERGR